MGYFTIRIRSRIGAPLFESDFTLHEFMPFVHQVTGMLEERPYLSDSLRNYKAIITPRYGRGPRPEEFIKPDPSLKKEEDQASDNAPLIIFDEEIEERALDRFSIDSSQYCDDGVNLACAQCPDQDRCTGGGRVSGEIDLADWIVLDPGSPRTNEPVRYFTLRIESQQGERLYERDLSVSVLQPFVDYVAHRLREEGRLTGPRQGAHGADIIARHDGEPRIDPALTPRRAKVYLVIRDPSLLDERRSHPQDAPEALVDWDEVEAEEEELEINLLEPEEEELPRQEPPSLSESRLVGIVTEEDLQIFVSQSVLNALRTTTRGLRDEIGGVLVGNVFLPLSNDRPYIKISNIIPATDALGERTSLTLDYHLWRQIERQLADEFPGQRTVGWYRFHLYGRIRMTLYPDRHMVHAGTGKRLFLTKEERFIHESFFQEPWHVGLIIDAVEEHYRFYQWQGDRIIECPGYYVVK